MRSRMRKLTNSQELLSIMRQLPGPVTSGELRLALLDHGIEIRYYQLWQMTRRLRDQGKIEMYKTYDRRAGVRNLLRVREEKTNAA